jgi:hypothetical protein
MTIAVIGATGRRQRDRPGVLARGDAAAALIRDPARPAAPSANPAGCTSGPPAWTTRDTEALADPHGVHRDGINRDRASRMDRDQRRRRDLLDQAGHPPISAQHLGGLRWDQPASHYSIDQFASSTAVPYSTIRPGSSGRCSPRRAVRACAPGPAWPNSGRMALIDHRDAAEAGLRVLTTRRYGARTTTTGTGPPVAAGALELLGGTRRIRHRVAAERYSSSASPAPGYRRDR